MAARPLLPPNPPPPTHTHTHLNHSTMRRAPGAAAAAAAELWAAMAGGGDVLSAAVELALARARVLARLGLCAMRAHHTGKALAGGCRLEWELRAEEEGLGVGGVVRGLAAGCKVGGL